MVALIIALIVLACAALPWWYRWCDHKEELARIEAHIEEIRCCYASEQSFLDIEDDPEHLASISPLASRMPSLTEEERAEAERELADEIA